MNQSSDSKVDQWRISRRGFLIGAGATSVALGIAAGLPRLRRLTASTLDDGQIVLNRIAGPPLTWFELDGDNTIRFFVPKVEMGQGIHTALAQIAAEELAVTVADITVVQASTSRGYRDAGTGNSDSVFSTYQPIREAAAVLREWLRQAGAAQLGVAVDAVSVGATAVYLTTNPQQRRTYGQIVQTTDFSQWDVPADPPPLTPTADFKVIGQPVPRVDMVDKIMGKAVYGYDMRLPNMLYGAVARPPSIGATLKRAALGTAPDAPGVTAVVIKPDFAGVAARSRQQARNGLLNLVLEWQEEHPWQQVEIDDMITVGNGKRVVVQQDGAAPKMPAASAITAAYRTPLAAHAQLEPPAALVDVQPGKVTAWVSTQAANLVQRTLAKALRVPADTVEVIPTYLGGGLGRKLNVKVAVEAAWLSQAAGLPVHVGWTRTEEMRNGFFRQPTHHVMQGWLSDNGRIQAMSHDLATSDALFPLLPAALRPLLGADGGAYRGALIQYEAIPQRQALSHHIQIPIPTGPWRGLGLLPNIFAIESFMDELAHAAQADPLAFRLAHLGDAERSQRLRRVLQTAADRANWGKVPAAGLARGLACCIDVNTAVAQVAEVSVVDGRVRVHKLTSVVDPGLVINPDGATAQIQGAIMMGLSAALHEEIVIRDGQVTAANFDNYPLLTLHEAPQIDVVLLESGERPYGLGEPPIGPVAAAVANAVFALTGERLRHLPLRLGGASGERGSGNRDW